MKFKINSKEFARGLNTVSKIMTKKIIAEPAVEITAGEKEVILKSNNLEIEIEARIPATVLEPGTTYVPISGFVPFVAKLSEEEIEFFIEGSKACIQYGRNSSAEFRVQDGALFTELAGKSEIEVTLGSEELFYALQKVLPAVATHSHISTLEGVLFDASGGSISLVSSDSFRLALTTIDLENCESECSFVLPRITAKELIRLLSRGNEKTKITLGQNIASFDLGEIKLSSRLIGGRFPDYKKILNQKSNQFDTILSVEAEQLIEAVERCILLEPKYVILKAAEKHLVIQAESEIGTAKETVPILEIKKGQKFELAVNPKYLIDGVSGIMAEVIDLNFSKPTEPLFITPSEHVSDVHLVLPMRVNGVGEKKDKDAA